MVAIVVIKSKEAIKEKKKTQRRDTFSVFLSFFLSFLVITFCAALHVKRQWTVT